LAKNIMSNSDQDQPGARPGQHHVNANTTMADRDPAAKAALDNMARLKALRLAREANTPQPAKAAPKARAKGKKADEKPKALSDWLASQQSGGRRT
jgi:hypothetical protein